MSLLIATTCLIFTGCSADMKVVEEDATEKLQDSKLSPYIEETIYKAGNRNKDETSVNIKINVDEGFSDLEKVEKYEVMSDAIAKLVGSSNLIKCGDDNYCIYDNIQISYDNNNYKMSVIDKELVINDNERYTKSDYKSDIDQVNKIDPSEKYKGNYNSVPSSSTGQGQSSTNAPKKDSANYDANGNYKPVDQMKPEEIKKELEGMLEESLKR
ncbi:hypothetical protein QCI77_29380 [Bacillus cereus group sp. MG9]|uniref:hypothetical protein n=1 Tax=Bacillus cereus group sp. MG9 TaxID=3040247 RepID=UPI00339374B8